MTARQRLGATALICVAVVLAVITWSISLNRNLFFVNAVKTLTSVNSATPETLWPPDSSHILAVDPNTDRLATFAQWVAVVSRRRSQLSEAQGAATPVDVLDQGITHNGWKLASLLWQPTNFALNQTALLTLRWTMDSTACPTSTTAPLVASLTTTLEQTLPVTNLISNGDAEWWHDPSLRPFPLPWKLMFRDAQPQTIVASYTQDPTDASNQVLRLQGVFDETLLYTTPALETSTTYLFMGRVLSPHPMIVAVMELDTAGNRWPMLIRTAASPKWQTYAATLAITDPANAVVYFGVSANETVYIDDFRLVRIDPPQVAPCQ